MFQWAQKTFDQISQTVAPPPQDGPSRFAYHVQRKEEDAALGCIGEFDPVYTVVNNAKGWYPIHMACQYSLIRLIHQLLNYPGMNIEQVDMIGNTPLHHACTSSDLRALEVVQLLVNERGANVLAKNSQGQTPYDLASSNNVRQFLLPIQLQKETQIALDNGGQGLPPGIDLGGLRIKNSNMAPPPMSFGCSEPRAHSTSMYPPTPLPADPSKIASAPATMPPNVNTTATSNTTGGYSLKGSSSAAIFSSKYSADGFHSSSSDVNLQQKYGHDTASRQYVTAPPPSSGNATSLSSLSDGAPMSGNLGGDAMNNPFSRGSTLPKQRYVSYGTTATHDAPSPAFNQFSPTPAPVAAAYNTFTPNTAAAQAPAPGVPPSPAEPVAQNAINTPTTPFMPPPPYQTQNYDSPSKQPGFVSPAAATYGGSPMTPMVPSTAPVSGGSARDLFAAPAANPSASTAPAPISTGSAHELFGTPQPAKPTRTEPNVPSAAPVSGGSAHDLFAAPASTASAPTSTGAQELFVASQPTEPTTKESEVPAETAPSLPSEGPDGGDEQAPAGEETKDAGVPEDQRRQSDSKPDEGTGTIQEETAPVTEATPDNTSTEAEPKSGAETSDWVETTDPSSGQVYYYNALTQETSWEDPRPQASESSLSDWVETEDPSSGKVYYYNKVTHETSWEKPSELGTSEASTNDQTHDQTNENDWVETVDPTSRKTYYYNQRTQETSWEKPASMIQDGDNKVAASEGSSDWIETVDPSTGQVYYYNQVTQETSWEKPAAMIESEAPSVPPTDSQSEEKITAAEEPKSDSTPPNDWMETVDPTSGQTYYYNSRTGETSWEKPEAAKEEATVPATQEESSGVEPSDAIPPQEMTKRVSAHDLFGASEPVGVPPTLEVPTKAEQADAEPAATTNETTTSEGTAPVSCSDTKPEDTGSQTFQAPPMQSEDSGSLDATQTFGSAPAATQTFQAPPMPSEDTAQADAAQMFGSAPAPTQTFQTPPLTSEDAALGDAAQLFGSPAETKAQLPTMSSTDAQTFQPPHISSGDATEKAAEPASTNEVDVSGTPSAETAPPKEEELQPVVDEKKTVEQDLSGEGEMLDIPLSPDLTPAPVKPIDQSADLFAAIGMPPPPFQSKR